MTQCNSLNVKLLNSQLSNLKSALKNEIELVLTLSSNMVGNFNDEIIFPHKLILTSIPVASLHKYFVNHLSTDIKLSKLQLSKMMQSGEFLGKIFVPLLKTRLPLMKNVIKALPKNVLIPLGLTAAATAADAGIHKK